MGEEYTVTIPTPDADWGDDEVEVTIESLGGLSRMRVIGKMPDESVEHIQRAAPENDENVYGVPPKFEEFMKILVGETSDFPVELLDELETDGITALIEVCCAGLAGEEPDLEDEDDDASDVFDGIELDEDGTVDPDEWR